jgi:RNA polymerase sigma-70 factor, ECF subfamily
MRAFERDPFADPAPLIRRVYSYVAYRIGSGAEAEDVTSEVFERGLRYRASFDETRGGAAAWLLGIARRCVDDALTQRRPEAQLEAAERASAEDVEEEAVHRITVAKAIERLDERSRDLLALRYGADLTAREIGRILDMKPNAVEVALHRALLKARTELAGRDDSTPATAKHEHRLAP